MKGLESKVFLFRKCHRKRFIPVIIVVMGGNCGPKAKGVMRSERERDAL